MVPHPHMAQRTEEEEEGEGGGSRARRELGNSKGGAGRGLEARPLLSVYFLDYFLSAALPTQLPKPAAGKSTRPKPQRPWASHVEHGATLGTRTN